ncbi:MAG: GIY-YIG nuclease family protein [bacterium]
MLKDINVIKINLKEIPSLPGVYFFKKKDIIIYIGKAKNLKNRIRSYLTVKDAKTKEIVENSDNLEYLITNSELEAQILESKLIYEKKPKYNIQYKYKNPLKYIVVIDKDGYPYFSLSSDFDSYTKEIFGPFITSINYKELFKMMGTIFGIRQCQYDFRKIRPPLCLYYHLGYCSGPCQNMISKNQYNQNFNKSLEIIKMQKKTIDQLIQEYEQKIKELSEKLEYEKAIIYRNKLRTLLSYKHKVLESNQAVYLYLCKDEYVTILGVFTAPTNLKILEIENAEELSPEQILFNTILNIKSNPIFIQPQYLESLKEFITNYLKNYQDEISEKLQNICLSSTNDENFLYLEKVCNQKIQYYQQNNVYLILEKLCKLLKIDAIYRIEAIDVSHFYGDNVYGSLVVSEKGKLNKSKYRIFKLSHAHDDLMNVYELVYRRFTSSLLKDITPQLIIVDGGINQLSYAIKAYNDSKTRLNIKFMSIAKPDDKIYIYDHEIKQIQLEENILNFIRKLRDEAHRFANSRRIKFSSKIVI